MGAIVFECLFRLAVDVADVTDIIFPYPDSGAVPCVYDELVTIDSPFYKSLSKSLSHITKAMDAVQSPAAVRYCMSYLMFRLEHASPLVLLLGITFSFSFPQLALQARDDARVLPCIFAAFNRMLLDHVLLSADSQAKSQTGPDACLLLMTVSVISASFF